MPRNVQNFSVPVLLGAVLAAWAGSAWAETTIEWWHAMTGARNQVVRELASAYNAGQDDFRVVPVFKGAYSEVLDAGLAAYEAGEPPHILQVFDVGTGVMMNHEDAIVPVSEVLELAGGAFDKSRYLSGIVAYYSRPDGQMLSFPYNSSSPILFYNTSVYERAGLDPDAPPTTWPQVWEHARRIIDARAAPCGYTSTWLTWIHLENFAAWNNLQYATQENGLAGLDIELTINGPLFVRHLQDIADLASDGVFRYGGRTSEARNLFTSGECGIMTESSGGLGDIVDSGIDFRTGPLPYHPVARGAPQNTVPGGASLWVLAGHRDEHYAGVASFFDFISRPEVQARVHQVSGYLPVTMEAYEATKATGFYETHPGFEQPILQMIGKEPTANSRGIRAINLPELRDIQNDEFEAMLAGQQSARRALDNAVARGNRAIQDALAQQ